MNPKYLVLLAMPVLLAAGCTTEPTGTTGTLVLKITDQPNLEITEALVTISNIQVHKGDTGEWVTVVDEPQTFDLVAIKDAQELLGEKVLEAGQYTQIRLDVTEAKAVIDGTEQELNIPSGTVKLVRQFSIIEDQTTELLLDFDAQESIHESGSGKYIMNPTIKVLTPSEKSEEGCGNGVCDQGETVWSCSEDCRPAGGPVCGNGGCEGELEQQNCPEDCGTK